MRFLFKAWGSKIKKVLALRLLLILFPIVFLVAWTWVEKEFINENGKNQLTNGSSLPIAQQEKNKVKYAKDRLIVKFKKSSSKNIGLQLIEYFPLVDIYVFKVPTGETPENLISNISKREDIEYAEFDFLQYIDVFPNDPSFSSLWGLHNTGQTGGKADADIDAPEAWDYVTGSSNVVVAVIDTGVDYNHQDLQGNMWTNSGEIPGNGNDDDGNGYIDDYYGINAITGSGNPLDDHNHGTHCAGTIGAKGNNGVGVVGVNWNVKIMALKFLDSSGSGYTSDAIECIQYAINKGAHIMSNSWGGGGYSQALRDAILAAQNAGILFVAAAGNSSSNNDTYPHYPSSYDCENIIAVAATDHNDNIASFSNYGPTSVDVAAPGVSILSTVRNNGYATYDGTSMATPHVSGLAALLKAYNPGWNWIDIKRRILAGVDRLTSLSGKILTEGRINAYKSRIANVDIPHIFSVQPDCASPGSNVKIYGYSFGFTQGNGYVEFSGIIQTNVVSWSDEKIVCVVPYGFYGGNVYVHNTNGVKSNGYSVSASPAYYYEYLISNEFVGGGTAMNWRADDNAWAYPLPFNFNFFGTIYPAGSNIYISSNGYIDFVSPSADFTNSEQELITNKRIAPLWIDLRTDGTAQPGEDIYIYQDSQKLVIYWKAETFYYNEPMNFEVVLYSDGRIKFNYGFGNSNFQSVWTSGPTIGISGGGDCKYDISFYNNQNNLTYAMTDLYSVCQLPSTPANPTPSDGATNVSINTDLDWSDCQDAISYDVYFGTTSPPAFYGNSSVSFFDIPVLSLNNTYYWKVVAKNSCGESPSPVWSFTTLSQVTETVSPPSTPSGPSTGYVNTSYQYTTGGSSSSLGHQVQYLIYWGDGTNSGWLPVGTSSASHSWSSAGTYYIRAKARCATHPEIESEWSASLSMSIVSTGVSNYQILPEVIWASATGGGEWVSEVQITDMSGGSQVRAYFNYGGGSRRGPITLWTNSGGAGRSIKYSNLLSTLQSLDPSFTYYGKVGSVEFLTQDSNHKIQVVARTLNGNYSKTFPGLNDTSSNTADVTRSLMIQNVVSNATYRTFIGCFNPSDSSVTVEFRIYDSNGTQIGNTITKTFTGKDFQSFNLFSEAGRPYPTYSYDNAWVKVVGVSGTGRVMVFGATANNYTNDPAAHIAVQAVDGYENSPTNYQVLPEVIWASATGGGEWVTEVQIVDMSGGSSVQAYFNYGGGSRRGPINLWTNSGGAGRSIKYSNLLSTLQSLDPYFTYYGRVGSVEFQTQDSNHKIQVVARTLNGNYSKTFPGLNDNSSNTADTTRSLMIQNVVSNATYRTFIGCFNPSDSSVTVEFKIYDSNGTQIGNTITKTFTGKDFQSFNLFSEAGRPYPTYSYDNAWAKVTGISGSGRVMVFGATANNYTNDPAAHIAVQAQ